MANGLPHRQVESGAVPRESLRLCQKLGRNEYARRFYDTQDDFFDRYFAGPSLAACRAFGMTAKGGKESDRRQSCLRGPRKFVAPVLALVG